MENEIKFIKREFSNVLQKEPEKDKFSTNWIKEEKDDLSKIYDKIIDSSNLHKKYICYHCGDHFSNLRSLRKHIKTVHLHSFVKEERVHQYQCPNCSFKSYNFSDLENHMLLEIQRRCQLCNYISTNEEDLLVHKCLEEDKVTFECPLFELSSLPTETTPEGLLICKICGYTTANVDALQNHVRSRHSEKRPFPCAHCPRSYSYASSLKIHINSRHERKKEWVCPYCGTSLTRSHTLKDHIRAVHFRERPYACPHCDYCAPVSSYLKAHIKGKHGTEKPYQCPYCPYKSVRSNTLGSHVRTRHTNDKPHKCSQCPFSCLRPSFLQQHILSKHSSERPHACQYCDYATVRSANLRSHMKIHAKAGIQVATTDAKIANITRCK